MKYSSKFFAHLMLRILSIIIGFHLLVLFGVIPFSIVWGGRLTSPSDMYVFETISLVVNAGIVYVILNRIGHFSTLSPAVVHRILWALCILFSLNTIGNIFSRSHIEQLIFTPLTALSAFCMYKLAQK